MHPGESLIVAAASPDAAGFVLVRPRSIPGRRGRTLLLASLQRIAPRADPAALDRLLERPGSRDDLLVAAVGSRETGESGGSGGSGGSGARPPNGPVIAAAFALPGPGRTAQLIAGRPSNPEELAALSTVLEAVAAALRPDEAAIAQTLLDLTPDAAHDGGPLEQAFLAAGFERLAILDYLARPLRRGEHPEPPARPSGVTLHPWRRDDPEILSVLESTYIETRDCPRLCGMRRTEDILAGHLAAGRHEPQLWTILRVDGIPSGVILVSPSHVGAELELVYLGLAPTVRGRGLARLLLDHALHQASARRERRMCLAVDRSNPGAVALYRGAGFAPIASRMALIRSVGPVGPVGPVGFGENVPSRT